MGRFIILAVLLCTACRPSGSAQTPPDFFQPTVYGEVEEEGGPPLHLQGIHPAEDFPWIDSGGKPIWFHPVSEDTDWTHWDAWPVRTDIEDSQSRASVEEQSDVWHIRAGFGLGSAYQFVESFPDEEQAEVAQDVWFAFGGPFAHEYLHVFQAPRSLTPEQEPELRFLTYELEDGYLVRFVEGGSLLIAFVTRDGDRYVTALPPEFEGLFDSVRAEIPVIRIFPSHEVAIEETYVVACRPALCDRLRRRQMTPDGDHPDVPEE